MHPQSEKKIHNNFKLLKFQTFYNQILIISNYLISVDIMILFFLNPDAPDHDSFVFYLVLLDQTTSEDDPAKISQVENIM